MTETFTTVRKLLALALCPVLLAGSLVAQSPEGIRFVVLEGEGAIHNIRRTSATQLRVQLQTENARPLPRTPVTFVVPSSGPGGKFGDGRSTLTVLTDKEGVAVARGFQPNGSVGQFPVRVSATYRGEIARTTVMQTNAAPVETSQRRTMLWVALIGAAVVGIAIALSAGNSGDAADGPADTPFGPNR